MIRDHVKQLLLSGSSVGHPFKRNCEDWYSEVEIAALQEGGYLFKIDNGLKIIEDIDEAVEKFCNAAFSPSNLALIQRMAKIHGLGEIDFEDESEENLRNIQEIKEKYEKEYFEKDFPGLSVPME